MAIFESIKDRNNSLEGCVKWVRERCLPLHDKFDRDVWKFKLSFHNSEHVLSVLFFAQKYIDYISNQENNQDINNRNNTNNRDVLLLLESLNSWNLTNSTQISLKELRHVIEIAILFHDIGNIANISNSGEVKFLDKYTSENAEARSAQIALYVLEKFGIDHKYIKLVEHLIGQTTYQPDGDIRQIPFGLFMRTVDQLGGNTVRVDENEGNRRCDTSLYSQIIKKRVLGLLIEMKEEGMGDLYVDPKFFLNFLRSRGAMLLGNEEIVQQLMSNLELQLPPEIDVANLQKERIKVTELIEILTEELHLSSFEN